MLIWIGTFLLVAVAFLGISFAGAFLIKKIRKIPYGGTSAEYECGELPHHENKLPFKPSFLIVGLVFIIFELEILYIFPWALHSETKMPGIIFLIILMLPWILFLKWDVLDWEKTRKSPSKNALPEEYGNFNKNPWYENRN